MLDQPSSWAARRRLGIVGFEQTDATGGGRPILRDRSAEVHAVTGGAGLHFHVERTLCRLVEREVDRGSGAGGGMATVSCSGIPITLPPTASTGASAWRDASTIVAMHAPSDATKIVPPSQTTGCRNHTPVSRFM